MEVKPGYKLTEVGIIPEDWEVRQLSEMATIATGNTPPTNDRSNYGDKFFFVSPTDIGDDKYVLKTEKMLSNKGFNLSRAFPKNTVLFVCIGSTIGKCGMASVTLTANQQINAIFPTPTISSDYLYYGICLASARIKALAGEQAVPIVNKTQFSETTIPLPPLPEQTAIATTLSDVDALISSMNALISKKKQIKQGAMQELLSGKRRLPGFSGEWEVKRLGEFGSTYGGLTGKTKSDFGSGKAFYITFMNIMSNVIINASEFDMVKIGSNEKQNRVLDNDIFFNGSSETPEEVGLCAVLQTKVENVYLNSFCFGYRLHINESADGLFLAYHFRSNVGRELLKSLAQGATRYNLSKKALLKVAFPLPPLPEQQAIAAILSDMDAEITTLESRRNKTKLLKQGMMQELLTGRIRLPMEHRAVSVRTKPTVGMQ